MSNTNLIKHFYDSFARGDAEAMVSCYDQHIVFEDPAFGQLKGNDAKNMWRMLVERSRGDIKVTYTNVHADDTTGHANWRAEYTFSQTGRKVINNVAAKFEFRNGKITTHTDHFNLWKWSRQALGFKGYLLGWTPFMKSKLQKQTNKLLKAYNKTAFPSP